jgi:hypothetical protein
MIADINAFSRHLIEFDRCVDGLDRAYQSKADTKFIFDSLPMFAEQMDSLIRNDRQSLILLQRLQSSIGRLIDEAPNLLFHKGLLKAAVKINPDPACLDSGIRFGLRALMMGTNDSRLRDLLVEAVMLGGICFKDMGMIKHGFGFDEAYRVGFTPWRATNKKQRAQAALATDVFTRLFENTLEHAYSIAPDTLDDNLYQILCGLMYFGGEPGTRAALALIPSYIPFVISKRHRNQPLHVQEVADDKKVMLVLTNLFDELKSSNVLYAMREHDHEAFNAYCMEFNATYYMEPEIIREDSIFDVCVLDRNEVNIAFVKKTVNKGFNCGETIDFKRAAQLKKSLTDFGIKGADLTETVTNSFLSDQLGYILALAFTLDAGKKIEDVPPATPIENMLSFGLNGPTLLAEHHTVDSLEGLVDFIDDKGGVVRRNSMVMGISLGNKDTIAMSQDKSAMDFVSAAMLYHYGVDVFTLLEKERESFSRLEMAAVAGRLLSEIKKDRTYFNDIFEEGVLSELARCAHHPVTRESISLLNKEAIGLFRKHMKWFTSDYTQGIVWTDKVIRGDRLGEALGL